MIFLQSDFGAEIAIIGFLMFCCGLLVRPGWEGGGGREGGRLLSQSSVTELCHRALSQSAVMECCHRMLSWGAIEELKSYFIVHLLYLSLARAYNGMA